MAGRPRSPHEGHHGRRNTQTRSPPSKSFKNCSPLGRYPRWLGSRNRMLKRATS